MKKRINGIELLIYLIYLLSLFAYELNIYNNYSYVQVILFFVVFITLLLLMKNEKYSKNFFDKLNNNKIVLILALIMIFNTLLCCLFYNLPLKNIIVVLIYIVNIIFFYFFVPIYFHENLDFTNKFTDFVIASISILSIFGIILFFNNGLLGYTLEGGRSASIFFDANYYALTACVPLILLLRKKYKVIIKLLIGIIALGGLLCSGSRGTMLGVAIGIIYFIFIKYPNTKKIRKLFFILLSLFLMYIFFLYLEKISFLRLDQGSHGRIEMFKYAIIEMKDSPIIGFGFGTISESLVEGGFANTNTHNSLIDFAFRYGYPCLVVYLLLIIKAIIKTIKDKNNIDIDILLIVLLVNMNTILYSFGGLGITSIILSVCLGIIGCYGGIKDEKC